MRTDELGRGNIWGRWRAGFLTGPKCSEAPVWPPRPESMNLMLVPKCQGCNESALNATIRSTLRQLEPAVTALTKAGLIDKAVVYGFDEMPAVYNNSLRRIYGAIKERFPMVKTMATLNAWVGWAEMDPSLPVDIWVETYNDGPQAQPIRAQQLPRWLKAGKQYCKLTRA